MKFAMNQKLIQMQGPCVGKTFRVVEVTNESMVRVVLDPLLPKFNQQPEWSHQDNYIPKYNEPFSR